MDDNDSLGGTLVSPIRQKKSVNGLELKWWDSEPFQTLRDPQTIRGSLKHKEVPNPLVKMRRRQRNFSGQPLLGVERPSPGIILKDIENEFRPAGDDEILE